MGSNANDSAAGPGDTPQEAALFAKLENEIAHESRYATPPVAAAARPLVTYGIISANVIVFAAETLCEGSTNPKVAIRFGALLPSEAAGGGWWRLLSASFLHFGVLHLAMYMLALLTLGPFVERILLRWRYTALYLGAGIGSMGVVILTRHFGLLNYDMLVGASGSIMGLVGATASIALRDSRIFKARATTSVLRRAAFIIVLQVIFDALTPQVSMGAHLGGLLSGYLLVQLLGIGR
jgi:rhomboid protease GluP